jgi:hypothetical protein
MDGILQIGQIVIDSNGFEFPISKFKTEVIEGEETYWASLGIIDDLGYGQREWLIGSKTQGFFYQESKWKLK